MSPRTDSQNELIREERRNQILAVALEVLAESGFVGTSISKIATRAKISKGLMYNYFASKEELIHEVMIDGFNQLIESFDANKDGTLTSDEMHYFIDATFATLENNISFWRTYFMVLLQPDVLQVVYPKLMEVLGPFLETAMKYFVENGYEDPEAQLRFFAGMLDGVGLHYIMDPENFPLEGVKKIIHGLFK